MSLLSNTAYYHKTLENFMAVFVSLFDGVSVIKRNEDGSVEQHIKVPITHAPKNKWLAAIKTRPELDHQQVNYILPAMSAEVVDIQYAKDRKIGTVGTFAYGYASDGQRYKVFNPAPYDVYIQLHIMCKTRGEINQILEQILPYFTPSLRIRLKVITEFGINMSVPLSFQNNSITDTFEGSPDDIRTVTYSIGFIANLNFFGPINMGTIETGTGSGQPVAKQILIAYSKFHDGDSSKTLEAVRAIGTVDPPIVQILNKPTVF